MSNRDPRLDPREGDELWREDGRRLIVDMVRDDAVFYRVVLPDGALLAMYRMGREAWTDSASAEATGFELSTLQS